MQVYNGKVTKVVDGDTVHVLIERTDKFFEVETTQRTTRIIRLRGVDTPERGQKDYTTAKNFTFSEVMNRNVSVEVVGVDKYNRELAFIKYDDKDLGSELVAAGLARVWID